MPVQLPEPQGVSSLMIRTDFSDDIVWREVCAAADADIYIDPDIPFHARLIFLDDPQFDCVTIEDIANAAAGVPGHRVVFLVDSVTLSHPEQPILAIDTQDEVGTAIRVTPSTVWVIENNVNEVNNEFASYAESARRSPDGIFRKWNS